MAPALDPDIRLDSFYAAILFTYVRVRLDPRLASFVAPLEEALVQWWEVYKKERELLDKQAAARALVAYTDMALTGTLDGVAGTALIETKNNRRSPLFRRYFGSKKPSRFRKTVLGSKLAEMRSWPPSLKESKNPALQAYGEVLITQIAAADEAVEGLAVIEQKLEDFQTFGERKLLFDLVNGLRQKLHGDISKMVYDHPEWNLSREYVDALFEHETSRRMLSDAALDKKIEAAEAELQKLLDIRKERLKEDEDEATERAEHEKKAKLDAVAEAEKAALEANARVAQLKAELKAELEESE